ncbi:MAG: Ku protein [bacterium]|nr:Ku protein [bacterium]
MARRTSWKGYLRLSLVSVPVKAFTANNTSETVRLNQLHAGCNSRVKYQKICPEHGELKSADIVSAYEYAKDQYVEIQTDELQKIRPHSDKSVHIQGFITPEEIDPIYHAGKTYYLTPDGLAGNKPYALLHRGMIDGGVVGIGKVVLSNREQLVLLRPVENMLVMTVLNVAKKVRSIEDVSGEIEDQEITKDELELTKTLIDASVLSDFDFDSFRDEYTDTLSALIQKKVDGEEIIQAKDHEEPKIINLMEALKASVAAANTGERKMAPSAKKEKSKPAKKKMAPSRGRKKPAARKKKSG